MSTLRFGLQLRLRNWAGLRDMAATADRLSWHSIWFPDHLVPPPYGTSKVTDDCFDGWSLLAGLTVLTQRVQLGCLVSANLFRNPALLAKMAATLDCMSQGRFTLGLGAGWYELEHRAYGFPFPALRERQDRLEEAASLLRQLLTARGPVTFKGRFYTLQDAPFAPAGAAGHRIPLMIGGSGELRTLRTVARHGDVMNVHGTVSDVVRKLEAVKRHCAECDRDPREIRCTLATQMVLTDDAEKAATARLEIGDDLDEAERMHSLLVGSAAHIQEVAHRYQEAGVDEIIIQALPFDTELLERIDQEVITAL